MVLEFFIPHYYGGGERRFHQLSKALVKKGHQVDILTMKIKNVPNYENIDGINVYHIGPTITNAPYRSTLNFLNYFFSVIKWLLKHDYDIIDAQAYSPLLSSKIASWIKNTPLIGTIHDTSSNNDDQWIQSSRTANFMEKFLVNLNFDKIITVSHATKNSLINDFGVQADKIEILYNGVDITKYDSIHIDNVVENQIIFVGRLAPHKHVDHLIRVIQKLQNTIPDIKLIIIGKGEEKTKLQEMIAELNLKEKIIFKQDLTDKELITEIKKSELLILPSTREGFGMVLAEANCCNKPVITYASGGTVEVVEDGYNGFLVEPENIKEITEKTINLLNNKKLQKQLGLNGRKKVEQVFNWDIIVDEYLKIVNQLIKQ